jgi:beta-glucanase (GH16 family)
MGYNIGNVKHRRLILPQQRLSAALLVLIGILIVLGVRQVIYSLAAAPAPAVSSSLAGDLNGDGIVNIFDLSTLLSKWGSSDVVADLNQDGTVNVLDLSALLSHWSQTAQDSCADPPPPAGIPVTGLKFCDSFRGTGLNTSNWNSFITSKGANGVPWNDNHSGGSGEGCNFDTEYYLPSQLSVGDGALNLTALEQQYAGGICAGATHTFPWVSGVVSSYKHFETNGGYVQFTMKAPPGNGMWPGLWMLPGPDANTTTDNFEIDIQEGGFLPAPSSHQLAWHLHQGTPQIGGEVDSGVDLTAGFHDYGIYWIPGQSITWYFDGRQIAQVTSADFVIPNEPMELIMNANVAGSNASGWHTVYDGTTPSPATMQVSNVQVWQ